MTAKRTGIKIRFIGLTQFSSPCPYLLLRMRFVTYFIDERRDRYFVTLNIAEIKALNCRLNNYDKKPPFFRNTLFTGMTNLRHLLEQAGISPIYPHETVTKRSTFCRYSPFPPLALHPFLKTDWDEEAVFVFGNQPC
ncbi:hypothetical protein [Paenibacillus sp. CECT 9249]|uniref:hypothetical protein n=1 Tax=Paenibacillus sp. CECT 9249 TaxID=2845385 RepID=UPI001E3A11D6|nr:hypothetical protein [Paenibacillus sp. CECT 9249]